MSFAVFKPARVSCWLSSETVRGTSIRIKNIVCFQGGSQFSVELFLCDSTFSVEASIGRNSSPKTLCSPCAPRTIGRIQSESSQLALEQIIPDKNLIQQSIVIAYQSSSGLDGSKGSFENSTDTSVAILQRGRLVGREDSRVSINFAFTSPRDRIVDLTSFNSLGRVQKDITLTVRQADKIANRNT